MAGTHLTFTVEDAAVRSMLASHAQQPGAQADAAPLAPRLGEYLQDATQQRFKTQTAPDGSAWLPLKPGTLRRKAYNRDKILTLRGYLRGNIHWQALDDSSVQVGSHLEYAAIHQLGGSIEQPARQATVRYRSKAGKVLFASRKHKKVTVRQVSMPAHTISVPARPYLGISAADDREIRRIIRDWVLERAVR